MDMNGTPPDPIDEALELMERIVATAETAGDDTGEIELAPV